MCERYYLPETFCTLTFLRRDGFTNRFDVNAGGVEEAERNKRDKSHASFILFVALSHAHAIVACVFLYFLSLLLFDRPSDERTMTTNSFETDDALRTPLPSVSPR